MSNKEDHRAQIDKYLKGKLDARAMNRLEREAQDDPFLMDALDGYEANGKDQQLNLTELQQRLTDRITPKKERSILLWRVLPIAAALLLMIGIGYWELIPKPEANKQVAALIKPQSQQLKSPAVVQPEIKELAPKPKNISATRSIPPVIKKRGLPEPLKQEGVIAAVQADKKTDTVDYKIAAYNQGKKESVDELLKHIQGLEVGSDGSLTHQGQAVTKVRINGKDFKGGNVAQATKNLPADIVDKIQVIDDYGDQAAKTGVKSGEPNKVLNITTNQIAAGKVGGKDSLLANNLAKAAPQLQLREVIIPKPNNAIIPGAVKNELKKQPDSSSVTRALEGRIAGVAVNKGKAIINKKITGRVVDKDNGQPLPGVTVKLKGSNTAVQTSTNGEFTITLPAADQTLTANYIGYQQQEIVVKNQDKLSVELSPSNASLNEVVVVGYDTQTKRDIAGSVADTTDKNVHPAMGQKAYKNYLQRNSKVTDGNTGKIKLAFTVDAHGRVNNIHVINSTVPALNQRAINLIQKGPAWVGAKNGKPKEIRIKIKFHK